MSHTVYRSVVNVRDSGIGMEIKDRRTEQPSPNAPIGVRAHAHPPKTRDNGMYMSHVRVDPGTWIFLSDSPMPHVQLRIDTLCTSAWCVGQPSYRRITSAELCVRQDVSVLRVVPDDYVPTDVEVDGISFSTVAPTVYVAKPAAAVATITKPSAAAPTPPTVMSAAAAAVATITKPAVMEPAAPAAAVARGGSSGTIVHAQRAFIADNVNSETVNISMMAAPAPPTPTPLSQPQVGGAPIQVPAKVVVVNPLCNAAFEAEKAHAAQVAANEAKAAAKAVDEAERAAKDAAHKQRVLERKRQMDEQNLVSKHNAKVNAARSKVTTLTVRIKSLCDRETKFRRKMLVGREPDREAIFGRKMPGREPDREERIAKTKFETERSELEEALKQAQEELALLQPVSSSSAASTNAACAMDSSM